MEYHYTAEKNILMLIALMKAHDVKKIIASPGSTNITFVASLMQDPYFEIYSAPDERSAAYMACGMAAASGEPIALSCTGATASRNYIPGLTEAFYRKLPVLAITSTQHSGQIGHYVPQVIDRSVPLNDMVNLSVQIPLIHDDMDAWAVNVSINKALLELRHCGGGPVHINLTTAYPFVPADFSVKELPDCRVIHRIEFGDVFPDLDAKKIGIFIGNHKPMDNKLTKAIEDFCERYNAVALCDHTSNYTGKYGLSASLITSQDTYFPSCAHIDTLIHIGEVSGSYMNFRCKEVWRVEQEGQIRDTFRKLKYVFEMGETEFFLYYVNSVTEFSTNTYFDEWMAEYQQLVDKMEEVPFSNIWMAQKTFDRLPANSSLYLGILNSLRAWNFFPLRKDITGFSNTGGFGIDGLMSSLLGSALSDKNRLFYEAIGDLAFFYDMNVLGNRHFPANIRILLINNGKGTEFRNYTHFASKFGDEADEYIAAGRHYGNKSNTLVKHYSEDLGFTYLTASTKEEYLNSLDVFCAPGIGDKPILLEVFTDNEDEDAALNIMRNLKQQKGKQAAKEIAKSILGDKGVATIKHLLKK